MNASGAAPVFRMANIKWWIQGNIVVKKKKKIFISLRSSSHFLGRKNKAH